MVIPHDCETDDERFLVLRVREHADCTTVHWYCPQCHETGEREYATADPTFYPPYDR